MIGLKDVRRGGAAIPGFSTDLPEVGHLISCLRQRRRRTFPGGHSLQKIHTLASNHFFPESRSGSGPHRVRSGLIKPRVSVSSGRAITLRLCSEMGSCPSRINLDNWDLFLHPVGRSDGVDGDPGPLPVAVSGDDVGQQDHQGAVLVSLPVILVDFLGGPSRVHNCRGRISKLTAWISLKFSISTASSSGSCLANSKRMRLLSAPAIGQLDDGRDRGRKGRTDHRIHIDP